MKQLTIAAMALWLTTQALASGVCEIQYEYKNRDRYVHGPVNVECGFPHEVHTAPFGNWGVDTESSDRRDGHQFQGWCQDRELVDNEGGRSKYCKDDWYQWHSCTTLIAKYRPQNCAFFNHANGTQQKTQYGSVINTHGSGQLNMVVSSPVDDDGDYYPDSGGCQDVLNYGFTLSGHRMDLIELDGNRWDDDDLGTLEFPTLTAPTSGTNCDIYDCDGGGTGSFRSKDSGSTYKASAKAAIRITGARFVNENCCDPLEDPSCN